MSAVHRRFVSWLAGRLLASLALYGACVGAGACAGEDSDERVAASAQAIWGGEAVAAGAFPNVVALDSGCSAILLASDLLITAGHCLPATRVLLGERVPFALDGATIETPAGTDRARSIALRECVAHPQAEIGSGADLAYCVLDEPVRGVPMPIVAVGCARAQIEVGAELTLVGYGLRSPDGAIAGEKRSVRAQLMQVGRELLIGSDDTGTCRGDSGGPALARIAEPDGSESWQLLGVMSSGPAGECGEGYYSDLSRHMDWLETTSEHDLTPCSDAFGEWDPSSDCRAAALDDDGLGSGKGSLLATCGAPAPSEPDAGKEPERSARDAASGCSAAGGGERLVPMLIALGWLFARARGGRAGRRATRRPRRAMFSRDEG